MGKTGPVRTFLNSAALFMRLPAVVEELLQDQKYHRLKDEVNLELKFKYLHLCQTKGFITTIISNIVITKFRNPD